MYWELPLNVPVDTSLSPYATVALGNDLYAKVVFFAYRCCVLGNLNQVLSSVHIYSELFSIIILHYKSCASFHLIKLFQVPLCVPF